MENLSFEALLLLFLSLLVLTVVFIIMSVKNTKEKNPRLFKVVTISLVVFVISVFLFGGVFKPFEPSTRNISKGIATCSSCKKQFKSGNDYNNIAKTSMCIRCYNNYSFGNNALGK